MSQDQKPLINTINTRQTRPQPVDSEYSDSSSTSLSDSASYDSYAPDWTDWIDEDDGSLFYIEYNFQTISLAKQSNETTNDANGSRTSNFSRALSTSTSTRRSKSSGSKLAKLINRNLKPMNKDTSTKTTKPGNTDSTKVKFSETAEGEVKIVSVMIDPSVRHKYGRRCTVCEALLGVGTSSAEGNRVIIDGFRPNSQLSLNKVIKVGDWLKAINDVEVNTDSIDSVLLNFQGPTEVKLSLQRTVAEESIIDHQNVVNKVTSLEDFVANAGLIFDSNKWDTDDMIFSVMYLTMKNSDEQSSDGQDVLFCYPAKEKNCLYTSRGSFLTLSSLLLSTFKTSPVATTMQVNNQDFHVIYQAYEEDLLIIAISSNYATIQEAKLKTMEIVRCIECLHQTVPTAIVHDHMWQNILSIVSQIYLSRDNTDNVLFEQALLEPHYVPLPKEAQIRIDDALGEMLAMDYREWNQDEPLKSHREFFMIGCSLYFKSYLLASHLPPADLIDIEAYLRVLGIFNVLESQTVKDMVLFREIYPKSVERGLVQKDHIYGIPKGRWFLAVCARYHTLLAVILESRQMTSSDEQLCITPSPFYIEEIQDTLEHLRSGGVENLAVTWISSNKRPQVIQEESENPIPNTTQEPQSKKTEIISILKRRNNSTENVGEFSKPVPLAGGSSVNSQTFSDDSNHKLDEDESDSDWDGFPDRSSSGFDVSELTETFLKEVSDVIPSKVTAGRENVLFHYVQLEIGQGVLLSSTGASKNSLIVKSFRKACLLIHTVLQNTTRFRFLLSQESNKPNWHRSLVAIKEHGILISVEDPDNSNDPVEFWVIGESLVSRDNRRFDAIVEQIQRKAERLHLSKLRSKEVTGDVDELLEWFRDMDASLRDADPPAIEPKLVRAQLQEHRSINDDISSQKGRVRDVTAAAKKVLRESQPNDNTAALREKLEDLKEVVDTVAQLCSDRLSILEQALPLSEHFADSHSTISAWLDDMEHQISLLSMPALRADQIAIQQDKNERLVQSIDEHKPLLDKLNKTGEALANLVADEDAAKINDILDSDNARYAALRTELRERQQALDQALQESSQFSDKLEGMLRALANTADQVNQADPISVHPPKIRDQIEDNNALIDDLDKRSEAFNAVKRAASDVIAKAGNTSDPAVEDIKKKLEKLNNLWNDLQKATSKRGGSLEDALAAAEKFWKQLQAVMDTLNDLEESLTSQEPPAAQPQEIKKQQVALQEIQCLRVAYIL